VDLRRGVIDYVQPIGNGPGWVSNPHVSTTRLRKKFFSLSATMVRTAYVIYTMIAIPFVAGKQREISPFKLLGILSSVIGGIVEEVFFRRWVMNMLMSGGFASSFQVIISGTIFGLAHTS
jgi:membrane protease YdiL (CAAX protease family)